MVAHGTGVRYVYDRAKQPLHLRSIALRRD
jgi:hypothetical protein